MQWILLGRYTNSCVVFWKPFINFGFCERRGISWPARASVISWMSVLREVGTLKNCSRTVVPGWLWRFVKSIISLCTRKQITVVPVHSLPHSPFLQERFGLLLLSQHFLPPLLRRLSFYQGFIRWYSVFIMDVSLLRTMSVWHSIPADKCTFWLTHTWMSYSSVSQTFFKRGPLSLVRMFYGPPYSWDYQTH